MAGEPVEKPSNGSPDSAAGELMPDGDRMGF